jgi:hypothetical protein
MTTAAQLGVIGRGRARRTSETGQRNRAGRIVRQVRAGRRGGEPQNGGVKRVRLTRP